MRTAKRLLLALAALLMASLPALAGFQQQQWQYSKELYSEKDGFALIELDKEVLEHGQPDLRDIRILDRDGREIPFQVAGKEPVKEETLSAMLIDRAYGKDFSTVTLDMRKENGLHSEIALTVSNKEDYLRDVKIEGSSDNKNWALLARGKIAHVSSGFRQDVIPYSPASFRYIRLQIENRDNIPLEVTGARVRFVPGRDTHGERQLSSTLLSVRTDREAKKTGVIVDLGAKGYFVGNILLENSGQNFDRPVQYYDSPDGEKWSGAGQDRIYHYKWPDYQSSKNTVSVNRYMGRYIKLEINNQDSQPLPVEGVKVYGGPPRLLAELKKGNSTLWYGSPGAEQPGYDLARFSHLIDRGGLPVIGLGPERANSGYSPGVRGVTEKYPWLLNLITAVCAAIVGLLILRNMRLKKVDG
ncbi:MAG: hypothetical protein ACOY4I_10975 [Bacillota bacterium]